MPRTSLRVALWLCGAVIGVGAVLVGVGARLAVGGALPRLPLALSLPLAGLLVQQAQAMFWHRRPSATSGAC